jgi:cell division protein FtsN
MRLISWRYYTVAFAVGFMIAFAIARYAAPTAPERQHAAAETSLHGVPPTLLNSPASRQPAVASRDASESGATHPDSVSLHAMLPVRRPSSRPVQRRTAQTQTPRRSPADNVTGSGTSAHAAAVKQTSGSPTGESNTGGSSADPVPAGITVEPTPAVSDSAPPTSFHVAPGASAPAGTGGPAQTAWETPRFHVQVGIFDKREDAEALVRRLGALGYIATAAGTHDEYDVWVGGYFDRETAESLAARLRGAGFDARLVP